MSGEEPLWLTPHLRDSQSEGEREREIKVLVKQHQSATEKNDKLHLPVVAIQL